MIIANSRIQHTTLIKVYIHIYIYIQSAPLFIIHSCEVMRYILFVNIIQIAIYCSFDLLHVNPNITFKRDSTHKWGDPVCFTPSQMPDEHEQQLEKLWPKKEGKMRICILVILNNASCSVLRVKKNIRTLIVITEFTQY